MLDMDEIVCTLEGDEFHRRRADLLPGLITRSVERAELPDGVRWRFAPEDGLLDCGGTLDTTNYPLTLLILGD